MSFILHLYCGFTRTKGFVCQPQFWLWLAKVVCKSTASPRTCFLVCWNTKVDLDRVESSCGNNRTWHHEDEKSRFGLRLWITCVRNQTGDDRVFHEKKVSIYCSCFSIPLMKELSVAFWCGFFLCPPQAQRSWKRREIGMTQNQNQHSNFLKSTGYF